MPKTSRKRPTALSTTPGISNRCGWVLSDGTYRRARMKPTIPTGTLMKKIHSQPRLSTRTPPRIGPTRVAMPAVAPHRPMAGAAAARREDAGDDRHGLRRHQRGAQALQDAGHDQRFDVAGEPAPQRGEGKDHQAGEVELLGPEPVTQPARDQQGNRIRQEIGAGHPDHGVDVGVQALHDPRVGYGNNGGVDEDHEEPDHQGPQCRPRLGYDFHSVILRDCRLPGGSGRPSPGDPGSPCGQTFARRPGRRAGRRQGPRLLQAARGPRRCSP